MRQQIPVLPLVQIKTFHDYLTNYYGMNDLQLQENAGRMVAALVKELYGPLRGLHVAIAVGLDFKAGVALAASRFLHNKGARVMTLLIGRPENASSERQLEILKRMTNKVHVIRWPSLKSVDVVIDGIAGFTLRQPPCGRLKELIEYVMSHDRPILSIEIPSGISMDDGKPFQVSIMARSTIALGIPKEPLFFESNKKHVGAIFLADVGIPLSAYKKVGIEMPILFSDAEVIRLVK